MMSPRYIYGFYPVPLGQGERRLTGELPGFIILPGSPEGAGLCEERNMQEENEGGAQDTGTQTSGQEAASEGTSGENGTEGTAAPQPGQPTGDAGEGDGDSGGGEAASEGTGSGE